MNSPHRSFKRSLRLRSPSLSAVSYSCYLPCLLLGQVVLHFQRVPAGEEKSETMHHFNEGPYRSAHMLRKPPMQTKTKKCTDRQRKTMTQSISCELFRKVPETSKSNEEQTLHLDLLLLLFGLSLAEFEPRGLGLIRLRWGTPNRPHPEQHEQTRHGYESGVSVKISFQHERVKLTFSPFTPSDPASPFKNKKKSNYNSLSLSLGDVVFRRMSGSRRVTVIRQMCDVWAWRSAQAGLAPTRAKIEQVDRVREHPKETHPHFHLLSARVGMWRNADECVCGAIAANRIETEVANEETGTLYLLSVRSSPTMKTLANMKRRQMRYLSVISEWGPMPLCRSLLLQLNDLQEPTAGGR